MGGDPFVMEATFKEVQGCRKAGIMINTFMLASDYYLVEFVKQMCAMTNGKAISQTLTTFRSCFDGFSSTSNQRVK